MFFPNLSVCLCPTLSPVSPGHLMVHLWTFHTWKQTQPNLMKKSKRSPHTYPDRIHHPNQDTLIIPHELNQKKWNHCTFKGHLPSLPFYICWRDWLQSPSFLPLPCVQPNRVPKGLHQASTPLPVQPWPVVSLTCSGPRRSPAAGLPSCIWIHAYQSLVSSPPQGLNKGEGRKLPFRKRTEGKGKQRKKKRMRMKRRRY